MPWRFRPCQTSAPLPFCASICGTPWPSTTPWPPTRAAGSSTSFWTTARSTTRTPATSSAPPVLWSPMPCSTAPRARRVTRRACGMRHALTFLRTAFLDPVTGGYAWLIDWQDGRATTQDATRHCYGMAFVMLAYARAYQAGVPEARAWLVDAFDTAEQHFWQPAAGLYADEASPDWQLTSYRGQNANMHACEAMISAFRATLHRACGATRARHLPAAGRAVRRRPCFRR